MPKLFTFAFNQQNTMESLVVELGEIIERHVPALLALSEDKLTLKSSPTKWSKKEVLGHLVDSAQNNIRRFIVAQHEELPLIIYNQDKWVAAVNYQQYDSKDLIQLWKLLNKHMIVVLKNITPELAERQCQTGGPHTIEWLANDYVTHLRHHLHQVLDLEPIAYP
jgi:hypothetical protein